MSTVLQTPPAEPFSLIGQRVRGVNEDAKCLGAISYTSDMHLPEMLALKILRSPHARARIVHIDDRDALALPGVFAVLSHKNVPDGLWGPNPKLGMEGVPILSDSVHFVGDAVAAVAAVDIETAELAASRIRVKYELQKPVLDPVAAAQPGAEQIHP